MEQLEPEPEPEPESESEPASSSTLAGAPATACPAVVLRSVLGTELFDQVRRDFFRIVESEFEPPEKEDSFTSGTYWFSLPAAGQHATPHNAIEAAAITISRSPQFREFVDVEELAGVEWWFQEQGAEDAAKDYHTDCDVQITRGIGGQDDVVVERRPHLSSVFYLDDFGGPTVVFGQTEPESGAGLSPRLPTTAVASFPHPNQFLVFRGDLFHGVLATTQPNPTERSRFTLLLNWWPERPHGPVDLPPCFAFGQTLEPTTSSGTGDSDMRQREYVEWVAPGHKSFTQSGHLPAWQAQQLPSELERVARPPGAPLRIRYGAPLPQQDSVEDNEKNWPEAEEG
jgi:hypothetical protein